MQARIPPGIAGGVATGKPARAFVSKTFLLLTRGDKRSSCRTGSWKNAYNGRISYSFGQARVCPPKVATANPLWHAISMCDTLVIVRDDGVFFAKNSDRDPNEAQGLEWHPRQTHKSGETVRCTYLEIPQVRETWAVLISRPFWMWGAEMGANEHGVVIGNEAVFTDQPYRAVGLTGMDLLRLALERAANAQEAVTVITSLLEQHGQGGGCGYENRRFTYHNSFLIADTKEAYVLETADRLWAVEKVSGVRSISNGLTIAGFAEKHSDRLRSFVAACNYRRIRTESMGNAARSVGDLFHVLRDHGTGTLQPEYHWMNGALRAPCAHAGGWLAATQTTASWVSVLTPGRQQHWVTATAAPCLSLFKPVSVEQPVEVGGFPTDVPDESTLWWRHERLHRWVARDPEYYAKHFLPERDAIETEWLVKPPSSEEAFSLHRSCLERWLDRIRALPTAKDKRPIFVQWYWSRRTPRELALSGSTSK